MKVSIFCMFGLKTPIYATTIGVLRLFHPLNGEWQQSDPQKAHPCVETRHMTHRSSKSVYWRRSSTIPRIERKRSTKKPKHVTRHMFAETTCVVAAPYGFACVVIPAVQRRQFQVSSKSVEQFWSHRGLNFALSHYWLLAFTTACTTVQAIKNTQQILETTMKPYHSWDHQTTSLQRQQFYTESLPSCCASWPYVSDPNQHQTPLSADAALSASLSAASYT